MFSCNSSDESNSDNQNESSHIDSVIAYESNFGTTGTITINSKREILYDTSDSLGNGKFVLVSSEACEKDIFENYDSFLTLKDVEKQGFWVSLTGHFLDSTPTEYMYERKKIFVDQIAFLGEDTTSVEIPTTDSMKVEKLF